VGATEYIDADLRDTSTILSQAAELLDFTKPVAVTLIAILHAIPGSDDPHAIVASLMHAVPSGSYLALSHLGPEFLDPDALRETEDVSGRMIQQQMTWRNREQVARFFAGTDLVEPGLVRVEEWRSEPGTGEAGRSPLWSGAGRKR
jgi:hypothetical protein